MQTSNYEKLGKFVAAFGQLESILQDQGISILLGFDSSPESQRMNTLICAQLEFAGKVNLLQSLISEKLDDEAVKKFKPIYKNLKESGSLRNDILHSTWYIDYGNGDGNLKTHKMNSKTQIASEQGKLDLNKAFKEMKEGDFDAYIEKIEKNKRDLIGFIYNLK